MRVPDRGEIYIVTLDPVVGHEQQGRRPVLVLTQRDFNVLTTAPLIVPITNGGGFARRIGYAVALPPTMRTTGVIRCDQPRIADMRERDAQFIELAPQDVVEDVLDRVASLLG